MTFFAVAVILFMASNWSRFKVIMKSVCICNQAIFSPWVVAASPQNNVFLFLTHSLSGCFDHVSGCAAV